MKCIHCGYENDGDFCLKCHKLIREEYLPKDETKNKYREALNIYYGSYLHPIIMKNYTLLGFLLGAFYSSYYKAFLVSIICTIFDFSLLFIYMHPLLIFNTEPFRILGFIIFRYLVYMTLHNAFIKCEIDFRLKKWINEDKSIEYMKKHSKHSVVYSFLTLFVYVLIILLFIKIN